MSIFDSFLELSDLHLSLILDLFPVNACTENRLFCWIARHHVLPLENHLVLVEFFHLAPNVKLKHSLVVLEPAVLDSSDVETWQGYNTWDDSAA